jgi:hypothetical protein
MTGRESSVTCRDFAIGVLGVSAVILLAALLTVNAFGPRQAMAIAQTAGVGDFLVPPARRDETAEILVILHTQQHLMNGYGFNVYSGQIEMIQQIDLERLTKDVERFRQEQRSLLGPGQGGPGEQGVEEEGPRPPGRRPRR